MTGICQAVGRRMDKIWLNRYQQQVPSEINPDCYASLDALFTESCKKYGNLPALSFFNTQISYHRWWQLSRDFAAYLQQKLRLGRDSRVALVLPNCPQYMISIFSVFFTGAAVVNINPLYTMSELIQQIQHSQAETVIISENFLPFLISGLERTRVKNVISSELGDLLAAPRSWIINLMAKRFTKNKGIKAGRIPSMPFLKALRMGKRLHLQPVSLSSEDIAFFQYTGGTTGKTKAAMLSHRNILANIEQMTAWVRPILSPGQETMITALPLYHIFSLTVNGLMGLRLGGNNVLVLDARNMKQLIATLARYRFSVLLGVNTLFKALLQHAAFTQLDFSSLKIALGGGAPIQTLVKMRWEEVTGKLLLEGYGLTEASPVVCAPPWDLAVSGTHVGLPLPSTDIRVCDEQGNPVPPGEVGELRVKGPQVMKGYWDPDEMSVAFDAEGWLLTGDLARLDKQGFVFIVGRKKKLILVSGFKVYTDEVEEIIERNPKVSGAAVIGVPSETTGEAVKAFVVRKDTTLTEQELLNHCRQYLTGYKLPTQFVFLERLPRSPLGKVLKDKLK